MAVSTSILHGNGKVTGPVQATEAFNKFAKDATALYTVGYRVKDIEGSEYVYSHFGADIGTGIVAAQDASESSLVDSDNVILPPASSVTTTDGSAGQNYVEITLASTTAGQYSGGKLVITGGAGEGYTYDIVYNTATNDPATGTIRVELKQPLQIGLTATSDFSITGSLYANLEAATGITTDAIVAGVTCAGMDVSEAAHGWIQVKGVVGVRNTGATTLGSMVAAASTVPGSVITQAGYTLPVLGWALDVSDDGFWGPINLKL